MQCIDTHKVEQMSHQITVRVPEELRNALSAASRRMQRKPSEVVRMALHAFLRSTADGQRPADGVQHLLGSLHCGVPDLAERHREYVLESLERGR